MNSSYFLTQEATSQILLRVTNVCGECYEDLKEGDTIHYDMQTYRYLCTSCQEVFCEIHKKESDAYDEEIEGLF